MKRALLFFLFLLFFQSIPAKNVSVVFNFPLGNGLNDIKENISLGDDKNAFSAFAQAADLRSLDLDVSYYDFDGDGIKESAFINAVQGISMSSDFSKYWQFSVNNVPALAGVSDFVPNDEDVVSLDYLDGKAQDAFEWLVDNQKSTGAFGGNLFQSAFGSMALSLAKDSNVNVSSTVINNGENFLLSQQAQDGGFGNDLFTAIAVMTLLSNGRELSDFDVNGKTSIDLLKEHQQADGGFKSGTNESDVDTTSWATIAFVQADALLPEKNGKTPANYLLSAQNSNGSFGYTASDSTESIDFSEEAMIALAAAQHPKDSNINNAIAWLSSKQDSDGCIADGFRTALGSIAFNTLNEQEKATKTFECLKTLQNGDGSFGRSSNTANAMDTAIAIIALSKNTFPLTVASGQNQSSGVLGLNSAVKFFVEIKNSGKVKAKNVYVELSGIPQDWIFSGSQGSINYFEEIAPGETRTAEIFAKLKSTGIFSVKAIVSTEQSTSKVNSNDVSLSVEEAMLNASLRVSG